MQKIFFSLVLLALCASQTSTPALAQAPAAESPARQEAPAQPEKQQPENMPPQTVTSEAPQADQQQAPASTDRTGSTGTGSAVGRVALLEAVEKAITAASWISRKNRKGERPVDHTASE